MRRAAPGPGPAEALGKAGAILQAAEALFAARGPEAVSISEIARAAGVSKANVFHHFGSKDELYLAVLRQACARSAAGLQPAAAGTAAVAVQRLRHFFVQHLEAILAQPEAARLIQRELMERGEQRGQALAEQVFADSFAGIVGLVEAAQGEGRVRADLDPALLAFLLVGANVFFFETRSVLNHLPGMQGMEQPGDYSRAVFDLLENGFAPRGERGEKG